MILVVEFYGNSTVLLKNRWPKAVEKGIDNSGEMLAEARRKYPQITFREEDIQYFSVREKIDCLFANASLQWLPYHEQLFSSQLLSESYAWRLFCFSNAK